MIFKTTDYTELELRIISAMFRRARSQPAPSVVTGRILRDYPIPRDYPRAPPEGMVLTPDGRGLSSAAFDQERAAEASRDAEQWRRSRRAQRKRYGV